MKQLLASTSSIPFGKEAEAANTHTVVTEAEAGAPADKRSEPKRRKTTAAFPETPKHPPAGLGLKRGQK